MKRLVTSAMALIAATPAFAQDAPGSVMQTLTIPSDHQPMYPLFYGLIYVGVALAAAFLIYVLVRSIKERTWTQEG